MEEDPAYLVSPFKTFVFRKMDDFASAYYVPQSVLMSGKKLVEEFFDIQLSPLLVSIIGTINQTPIFPESPYWTHHFSNGKVWNEYLANKLNLNLKDEAEYYNEAFGGSWATTYDHQLTTWNLIRYPVWSLKNLVQGKLLPPSLGLEIQAYLLNFGEANPNGLYFIYSGSNDYQNMLHFADNYNPKYMRQYVDYVISGITYSANKLIKSGVKHLVVVGVPDLGALPRFNQTTDRDILTRVSKLHNEQLKKAILEIEKASEDVKITFIDIQAILAPLFKDALNYGFTNVTEACLDAPLPTYAFTDDSPYHKVFGENDILEYVQSMHQNTQLGNLQEALTICNDPKQYAFWDEVHFSTKLHKYIADKIFEKISTAH